MSAPRIALSALLSQRTPVEHVRDPGNERFVTIALRGGGVRQRNVAEGKTPRPFTGYRVRTGQFIYSRIDARNGAFGLVPESLDGAVVSKDFPVFDMDRSLVDPRYLSVISSSPSFWNQIQALSFGATNRQRVTEPALLRLKVPLPSLDAQRQIADVVRRADALRENRRETLVRLDELTQSVFVGLFGDPRKPSAWQSRPLKDVAVAINDCPHSTPTWTEDGVICIRTANLGKGRWQWGDTRFVSQLDYAVRSRRGELQAGDLVLSREGTVGVAAIVPQGRQICMGQRLVQIRPNLDTVTAQYVLARLLFDLAPERIAHRMIGSTAQRVNVKSLAAMPIPVPPLELQVRYGLVAEHLERTRREAELHLTCLDELLASLQQRAFRGELFSSPTSPELIYAVA